MVCAAAGAACNALATPAARESVRILSIFMGPPGSEAGRRPAFSRINAIPPPETPTARRRSSASAWATPKGQKKNPRLAGGGFVLLPGAWLLAPGSFLHIHITHAAHPAARHATGHAPFFLRQLGDHRIG